jgi:hypothetical protein
MTRSSFLPACALALLAFSLPAHAEAPAGVEPPGFSFIGHWSCAGAMASGRAHRSVYVGAKSAVPGAVELTETDVDPKGYVGRYILAYDAARKQVVEADVNNAGASIYRGDGWRDGKLAVTTSDGGDFRFVFQVDGPQRFQVTWQVEKDGAWRDGDHLACTRDGAVA